MKKDLESISKLTLDFSKAEYISSAGLRELLSAHKTMSKKIGRKPTNISEFVREVFDVAGLAGILDIE